MKRFMQVCYHALLQLNFALQYGDRHFPRTLRLEISSHCNRRCTYCPNVFAANPVEYISEEVLGAFLNRIAEIRWAGAVDFIFFNEPTLHPKLPEIVRRVKLAAPCCRPVVTSNGDLLTPALGEELVNAGVVKIFTMHHRPHRPGWWEQIRRVQAIIPGVVEVTDITELEEESGLYDYAGKVEVNKVREKHRIRDVVACDMHENCGQIDINGDWLLCCVDYSRSTVFGNIKTEGLLDIWRKPEFEAIRNGLRAGTPTLEICKSCTCFTGT